MKQTTRYFLSVCAAAILTSVSVKADLAVAEPAAQEQVSPLSETLAFQAKAAADQWTNNKGNIKALLEAVSDYFEDEDFHAPGDKADESKRQFTKKEIVEALAQQLERDNKKTRRRKKLLLRAYFDSALSATVGIEENHFSAHEVDEALVKEVAVACTQRFGWSSRFCEGVFEYISKKVKESSDEDVSKIVEGAIENGDQASNASHRYEVRLEKDVLQQIAKKMGGNDFAFLEKMKKVVGFFFLEHVVRLFDPASEIGPHKFDRHNERLIGLSILGQYFDQLSHAVSMKHPMHYSPLPKEAHKRFVSIVAKLSKVDWGAQKWQDSFVSVFNPSGELRKHIAASYFTQELNKDGKNVKLRASIDDIHKMAIHQDFKNEVSKAVQTDVERELFELKEGWDFLPKMLDVNWAISGAVIENFRWDNTAPIYRERLLTFINTFKGVRSPKTATEFFRYNVYAAFGRQAEKALKRLERLIARRKQSPNKSFSVKFEDFCNESSIEELVGDESKKRFVKKLALVERVEQLKKELPKEWENWDSIDKEAREALDDSYFLPKTTNLKGGAEKLFGEIEASVYKPLTTTICKNSREKLVGLKLSWVEKTDNSVPGCIYLDRVVADLEHYRCWARMIPVLKQQQKLLLGQEKTIGEALAHTEYDFDGGTVHVQENELVKNFYIKIFESNEADWKKAGGLWAFVNEHLETALAVREKMGECASVWKKEGQTLPSLYGDLTEGSLDGKIDLLRYQISDRAQEKNKLSRVVRGALDLEQRKKLFDKYGIGTINYSSRLCGFKIDGWKDFIRLVDRYRVRMNKCIKDLEAELESMGGE